MKKTILIIGIIAFIGCKQSENSNSKTSDIATEKQIKKIEIEKNTITKKILNQDSLSILWESNLKKIALLDDRFDLRKEPFTNHHDKSIIDTINTFTYKKSIINIYKAQNFEAIMNAKIQNSDIEIMDYLRIGTKKNLIEKTLETRIPNDNLKVGNLEQTVVFTLKFQSGELIAVEFDGYVD
tara:strand:- start:100 stop:645 length:546 start_codon:yes stop_codon:yes gene_type:complete